MYTRALCAMCLVIFAVRIASWAYAARPVRERVVAVDLASAAVRILYPGDVAVDGPFAKDFWGTVSISPVPAFHIDTHDPVSQDIFISGNVHLGRGPWDPYVWVRLVSILQAAARPACVVDAGANLGYFSLAAASFGARVVAFEPMSRNARKLSKSIAKNGFHDRIALYQNALWGEGPSFPVRLVATSNTNQGNGQASDSAIAARGVYGLDYVRTVALSDVVNQDVDLLKIDTEGAEGAVIAGARRLICGFRVHNVIVEFTEVRHRSDKYSARDMLRFMDSAGYIVSDIIPGAPPLDIADYDDFPPNLLFSLRGDRATCVP